MSETDKLLLEHENRLLKAQKQYLLKKEALSISSGKIKAELMSAYLDEINRLKKELNLVI